MSKLPLVAVDPFRKRRGRWERRHRQRDAQSGVGTNDSKPLAADSGSPAPAKMDSTASIPAIPSKESDRQSIVSEHTGPVVAEAEVASMSRDLVSPQSHSGARASSYPDPSIQGPRQHTGSTSLPPAPGTDTAPAAGPSHQSKDASASRLMTTPKNQPLTRGRPVSTPRHAVDTRIRDLLSDIRVYLHNFPIDICVYLHNFSIELYIWLYLRLPPSYFSQIAAVFEDSQLNAADVKWLGSLCDASTTIETRVTRQRQINTDDIPPSLKHLKRAWGKHIDKLLKQWKTLNIVAGLVLTAASTMLQIDAAAANLIVRTTALLALVCTLVSLLYGCLFMSRFISMKELHMAYPFLETMTNEETSVWWNEWIMLALPAIWLTWSIIAFLVSILSFVWAAGTSGEATEPSATYRQALAPRVVISATLAIGAIYFVPVIQKLKRYGAIQYRLREQVQEMGMYV